MRCRCWGRFNKKNGNFDLNYGNDSVVFELPSSLFNLQAKTAPFSSCQSLYCIYTPCSEAKTPHPSASRPPSPPRGRLAVNGAFHSFLLLLYCFSNLPENDRCQRLPLRGACGERHVSQLLQLLYCLIVFGICRKIIAVKGFLCEGPAPRASPKGTVQA